VLQEIFRCAKDFGLTSDEAWDEVDRALMRAGEDATVGEFLEELSVALAAGVLAKERRTLSERAAKPNACRSADTGRAARRG
jgi:hypothetical protein